MKKQTVAILGAGAWGTALAHFFATQGYTVFLWCYEDAVAQAINQEHINHIFLKNVPLPKNIHAFTDIYTVLSQDVAFVIEAIPVTYLALVLQQIDCEQALQHKWILTSKGLHPKTGMHTLDIMRELFGAQLKCMALSGPSFASELVQSLPTICVAATADQAFLNLFQTYWQSSYTSIVFSEDATGVLLCGAVKNVLAVLLGMLDGAGYGKNTQAFLLTYAYQELKKLVFMFGGRQETVDGLAGFGDLFLTASTNTSKNRMYGYLIGQQKTTAEIQNQLPVLPEGVSTAAGLHVLLSRQKGDMQKQVPLLNAVHQLLAEKISIHFLVEQYVVKK